MSEQSYRQFRYAQPPGSTEIFLVRHGESEPSRPGHPFPLVDGHADPALAPEGEREAELVGDRLRYERLDAVYVSPLRRTHQTAAPLARHLGLEPAVEPDVREVYLGEWEGGLFRMMVADNGELAQRMWDEERWDVIPGAESNDALAARLRAAVRRLHERHVDQRIAVFSHGGVIGTILALAARSSPFAFVGADNASISLLVVLGDRWLVRCFNDTAHLDPRFTLTPAPLT